jgi:predicted N-acyltransferase
VYLGHDWLKPIERSASATAHYVVATGAGGELLAAAPCYVVERERNAFYRVDLLGLQEEPTAGYVLAGARRGYHNGVLVNDEIDAELRRRAVRAVLDRIRADVGEVGAGWWLYVTDDAVPELCESLDCAVPVFLDIEGRVHLPGHTWDDFIRGLPASRRNTVRRERRVSAGAGYTISVVRLDECWYEAGPLLAKVQGRYGHDDSVDEARDYLANLASGSTSPGSVILCRRNDQLIGYCHFYDFGTTRWIRSFGLDYPNLVAAFEYFELVYYLPILGAYAAGLSSVHYGIKSAQAKALRGATLHPLWAIPIGAAAATWPQRRCRAHNRAALAATRDRLGRAFAGVDGSRWVTYV